MGLRRALKERRYTYGVAPSGYSWDRSGIHPMIKPNENAGLVKEYFELYSTGLSFIEGIYRLLQDKGMNIQKTAFNRMLRNPLYKGNIIVPEITDEEERVVIAFMKPVFQKNLLIKCTALFDRAFS